MMEEKELISEIRELRKIKPEKKWVFLTKEKILGKEAVEIFPFFKPVYAGLFLFFILIGLFGVSQRSLPGEPLFYIKKISEKIQTRFFSEEEKSKVDLELANKRLEELSKIAEKNDARKLAPAISETKESVAEVTKNLVKSKKVDNEIVQKTLELERKKQKVEEVLGTKITEEESENPTMLVAKYLIEDLSKRTLTDEQKQTLEEAKKYFESGNYEKVLILLFPIGQ
jgi:hypothetical protein